MEKWVFTFARMYGHFNLFNSSFHIFVKVLLISSQWQNRGPDSFLQSLKYVLSWEDLWENIQMHCKWSQGDSCPLFLWKLYFPWNLQWRKMFLVVVKILVEPSDEYMSFNSLWSVAALPCRSRHLSASFIVSFIVSCSLFWRIPSDLYYNHSSDEISCGFAIDCSWNSCEMFEILWAIMDHSDIVSHLDRKF